MRKINLEMLEAFNNNSNKSLSNTLVKNGNIYLHGNHIVKTISDDAISINFCGYVTSTTASRINTIVSDFTKGEVEVGICKGEPELRNSNGFNQIIDDNEWVEIST